MVFVRPDVKVLTRPDRKEKWKGGDIKRRRRKGRERGDANISC